MRVRYHAMADNSGLTFLQPRSVKAIYASATRALLRDWMPHCDLKQHPMSDSGDLYAERR